MGSFLNRWDDPGYDPPSDWDPDLYAEQQAKRLVALACMAAEASNVKHRLGPDASREELAADKKRSKRMYSSFSQFARQWGADDDDFAAHQAQNAEDIKIKGAQVDWEKFQSNNKSFIQNELRQVATTCIRNGTLKLGNSFCNRLLNEVNVVANVLDRTKPKPPTATPTSTDTQ